MTVAQVAARYAVTPKTVYGWIKRGTVTAVRLPGGDYRFLPEHFAAIGCLVGNLTPPPSIPPEVERTPIRRAAPRGAFERGRAMATRDRDQGRVRKFT